LDAIGLHLHFISRERGSRACVSPVPGAVTNGLPASGAGWEKATAGLSLSLLASGKSFCSGKNGQKHSDSPFAQD